MGALEQMLLHGAAGTRVLGSGTGADDAAGDAVASPTHL